MASEFAVEGFLEHGGKRVKRTFQAETPDEAKAIARRDGIFPTKTTRVSEFYVKQRLNIRLPYSISRSVHVALAAQFGAGATTVDALGSLARSSTHRRSRWVMNRVRALCIEGTPLSSAMASFPRIWSNNMCAIMRAGERIGTPKARSDMFKQIIRYAEEMRELRNTLVQQLTMPIASVCMGAVVFGIMVFFTLPRMAKFYRDLGVKNLPYVTVILIDVGKWIDAHMEELALSGAVLAGVMIVLAYLGILKRMAWWVAMRTPILGRMLWMQAHQHFCTVFAEIFKATSSSNESLSYAATSIPVPNMRKAAVRVAELLQTEGQDFIQLLRNTGLFDGGLLDCLAPAQVQAQRGEICREYAESYRTEAKHLAGQFALFISFVALGVMLFIVILALVAYLAPMLRLINEMTART